MNTLTLIGLTVVAAYYMGHLAKKIKLPSLIGYMILGVILGRSGLDYFNIDLVEELGFINEIALGFVAFSIGIELSISSLKKQGIGIISIILVESFAAFFVVLGAVYLLTKDLPMSLIFAAMAPASAPAGTVAVIQDAKAPRSSKCLFSVPVSIQSLADRPNVVKSPVANAGRSCAVVACDGIGGESALGGEV